MRSFTRIYKCAPTYEMYTLFHEQTTVHKKGTKNLSPLAKKVR